MEVAGATFHTLPLDGAPCTGSDHANTSTPMLSKHTHALTASQHYTSTHVHMPLTAPPLGAGVVGSGLKHAALLGRELGAMASLNRCSTYTDMTSTSAVAATTTTTTTTTREVKNNKHELLRFSNLCLT
jgi:hypothetical protein